MDSATQDLYYQRIYELFYDEEKVVTCASLACELKITLDEAKALLTAFVNDRRQLKDAELSLTFLISGSLKDGKGLAVYLIKEEDLNQRSLFETIYSEIVFSIQKNKLVDFNAIALVNKTCTDGNPKLYLGSVIGKNCIKRTIKTNRLPLKEVVPVKEKRSWFQENNLSGGGENKSSSGGSQKNISQEQSKRTKPKQSGNIANFFSNSSLKTNGSIKSENGDDKFKNESLKPKNTKEMPLQDQLVSNTNEITIEKENSFSKVSFKVENLETASEKSENKDNNSEVTINKSQHKTSGKKRKKGNKNSTPNKKRKRIQEVCDSDSSDIFEDEEKEEDIIEKSDEEPEPLIKLETVPKKKIRKAVDKLSQDEEGFMVTTTEYIYESAPEDEEKEILKTNYKEENKVVLNKKNSSTDSENDLKSAKIKAKKNKNAASGKQTTIMSFFKKS